MQELESSDSRTRYKREEKQDNCPRTVAFFPSSLWHSSKFSICNVFLVSAHGLDSVVLVSSVSSPRIGISPRNPDVAGGSVRLTRRLSRGLTDLLSIAIYHFHQLPLSTTTSLLTMSTNGATDAPAAEPEVVSGSPSDFLKTVVGEQVVVRLNSGVDYRGSFSSNLLCWVSYRRIVLLRR